MYPWPFIFSKKVEEQKSEIERLQKILDAKIDIEKKQVGKVSEDVKLKHRA